MQASTVAECEVLEDTLVYMLFNATFENWLRVYNPDHYYFLNTNFPSRLYYSSMLGLLKITKWLLNEGLDVNAQGGYYGNALQAASLSGHEAVVRLLLGKDADVNAQGGNYGNVQGRDANSQSSD